MRPGFGERLVNYGGRFPLPQIPRPSNPTFSGLGGSILEALGSTPGDRIVGGMPLDVQFPEFGQPSLPPVLMPEEAGNPTGLGLGEMIQPTTTWAGNPIGPEGLGGPSPSTPGKRIKSRKTRPGIGKRATGKRARKITMPE